MAEQLPIVGHEYTHKYDGHRYVSNATASETLPGAVALTYHAPAQAALDELRREVEALRADRDRLHEALASVASICNETRAARDLQPRMTEIRGIARAAIDTARASTDEGVGK